MPGEIDLVTGKPVKNKERELLTALTPEEKAAQKAIKDEENKKKAEEKAKANVRYLSSCHLSSHFVILSFCRIMSRLISAYLTYKSPILSF